MQTIISMLMSDWQFFLKFPQLCFNVIQVSPLPPQSVLTADVFRVFDKKATLDTRPVKVEQAAPYSITLLHQPARLLRLEPWRRPGA